MGYPMTYKRLVSRNALSGDYAQPTDSFGECITPSFHHTCQCGTTRNHLIGLISGDLRRLESDQRDEAHLSAYARIAGITPEQVKAVLDAFFSSES